MDSPQIVHEVEVAKRGFLRSTIADFRGRKRIDVRMWVEPRDSPGADLIPTPKGINLPAEYAQELVEAAQALLAAVKGT